MGAPTAAKTSTKGRQKQQDACYKFITRATRTRYSWNAFKIRDANNGRDSNND
jgi:hypothetical protein